MNEVPKKYSASTIIITALAIIIIIILAFLLYFYSTRPAPSIPEVSAPIPKNVKAVHDPEGAPPIVPVVTVVPTNIVAFEPPQPLPTVQKSGKCFASSVAAPYRQDAFRCEIGNSIYDPCFTVAQKGFVYCQVGMDASTGFLMKLTQALPKVSAPATTQDNWAWYVTLKDGTECSPFTGTRPFFGTGPDAPVAYYGCKSNDKTQEIMLLGDLTEGTVWEAQEATLTKVGGVPSGSWTIQSTKQVDIDTVWQ